MSAGRRRQAAGTEGVHHMLRILRQRLQLDLDGAQAYQLQKEAASLSGLINGVRREYFRRLGLDDEEVEQWMLREQQLSSSPLLAGDVVLKDQETVLYYRVPRGQGFLEAGVITRGDMSDHVDFFDGLRAVVARVVGFEPDWQPAGVDGEVATTIAGDAAAVTPSPKEIESARELENEAAQTLLGQIMATGSVFFNKLTASLSPTDRTTTEKLIARFEDLGVVSKDFAVLCRKTGQQILRVSSRAAIEDPSQKTFKCFICGNPVSEELLDEIITVNDFGRKLLERDYWLVVRVLGALRAAGIPNSDVRIHTGEGQITNFFVTINDQLYLLVLTNRKLTLEESYLVNAHVAAYHLSHVVVISTERVSRLMRQHLQQTNPDCEFDFLDSLLDLEDRFMAVLGRKEKSALRQVLANFSALTPVHLQDVVMQKISPDPTFFEEPKPAPRPAPAPAARAAEAEAEAVEKRAAKAAAEEETSFPMMGEILDAEESLPEESQVTPG